ncbi:MAG: hypothetical protein ACOC7U_05400, partial [Spirochaetota bacterium]
GIDRVYTQEIEIGHLTGTSTMEAEVELPHRRVSLADNPLLKVKIVIKKNYLIKEIKGLSVVPVNVKQGLVAAPVQKSVSVTLKVPQTADRVSGSDISVSVDCSEIEEPGLHRLSVQVNSSVPGVTIIDSSPSNIDVQVNRE